MDFELTDEQRLIQETVRGFVDDRVLPVAVENDIAHRLDMDLIQGMADLGILGVVIPEEYGGAGLDFVAEALACEEIERGEAAFRTLISVHVGLNSLSLLRYGTEEQKQRWLTPQAKGEKLACFGLTEPGAGSDVAAMRTTARREGDVYVLSDPLGALAVAVCYSLLPYHKHRLKGLDSSKWHIAQSTKSTRNFSIHNPSSYTDMRPGQRSFS